MEVKVKNKVKISFTIILKASPKQIGKEVGTIKIVNKDIKSLLFRDLAIYLENYYK